MPVAAAAHGPHGGHGSSGLHAPGDRVVPHGAPSNASAPPLGRAAGAEGAPGQKPAEDAAGSAAVRDGRAAWEEDVDPMAVLGLELAPEAGGVTLSLAEAEAMTLRLLPQVQSARAALALAQATVLQSRAAWLPQLSGTGAYSRQTANFVLRPGSLPQSLSGSSATTSRSKSYNYWNFGLSLSQMVFDFGATYYTLAASRLGVDASAQSLRDAEQQALLATRLAYFDAANKQAQWRLADATLHNQRRHCDQVALQVQVGQRPPIDLASVETDVANAYAARITAQNAWDTARATLRQTLGVEGLAGEYVLRSEAMAPLEDEDAPLDVLHRLALQRRPDYASQRASVARSDASHKASRAAFLPTFTTSAGVTEAGENIRRMGWNWNVGAQVSWPLFDGGRSYGALRSAQAQAAQAQAQAATLRQSLRAEVEKSRLAVRAARALCDATRTALVQAQVQLRLAEGRYDKGLGQIIELGDAQLAASSAAAAAIDAKYALARARANLVRSLGR